MLFLFSKTNFNFKYVCFSKTVSFETGFLKYFFLCVLRNNHIVQPDGHYFACMKRLSPDETEELDVLLQKYRLDRLSLNSTPDGMAFLGSLDCGAYQW